MEKIILSILFSIFLGTLTAQNTVSHTVTISVPKIAILDIESSGSDDIEFIIDKPDEAGHTIDFSDIHHTGLWLNYSSVKSSGQPDRTILATLSGALPEGFHLYLEASDFNGSGKGKLGSSTGRKELTNQPVGIIDNIGSCYTGNGLNNGHALTYSLEFDDDNFGQIAQGNFNNISVTYTFLEN